MLKKVPGNMRDQWLTVAMLVVGCDQITKYWCIEHLSLVNAIKVFPGLDLTLRYNSGAAFNLLSDASGWQRWFFIGLAFVVCFVIYLWLGQLSRRDKQESFALSLILGGAFGNLLDRMINGHVTDFIVLYYKQWQWPAFNLADTAICIGVILLIPTLFWKHG